MLERTYQIAEWALKTAQPLLQYVGYDRIERVILPPEELTKKVIFDCRMCGQCILHATGMTCPMTCPKNLRNGPCGGVRPNGHCEVKPEMKCVWVQAYERSLKMPVYGRELIDIQPPVNRRLQGSSAWINKAKGVDRETPQGWPEAA